jgi:AmmeMemoRadiSam system protein A
VTIHADERRALLETARAAIRAGLAGQELAVPLEPPADVQGAFVTLRRRADGELRGCVGTLRPPRAGLRSLVAETAWASASRDSRFPPVEPGELAGLRIEISILGPLAELAAEAVVVGVHGLVVRRRGRHGLLLPQVAVEHQLDRETFLDWTCRKAGLLPGEWREPGCEISGFTAEVFGED